jgi:hypothetical protein
MSKSKNFEALEEALGPRDSVKRRKLVTVTTTFFQERHTARESQREMVCA